METGIADAKDNKRAIWADQYFRAVRPVVAPFCFFRQVSLFGHVLRSLPPPPPSGLE